jgi:exonuclease VII large subunit
MIRNLINRLDTWKDHLEKIETKLSTEKSEVNSEWNEVKSLMSDLLEQAKHSVEELNQEAKAGFEKKVTEIKSTFQEQDKELKQKISEKLHETRDDLTKLSEKIKTFNVLENSKRDVIKEEFKNGVSNISNNFSHVGTEFKEILHEMNTRAMAIKARLEEVENKKTVEKELYQNTVGDV